MEAKVWHIDEYRRALEDDEHCTPADMADHFDKILDRMRVDVMAHGNVASEEAEGLVDTVAAALGRPEPLPEAELPARHAIRLPAAGEGGEVVMVDLQAQTEEEKNSAVQVRYWFVCCFWGGGRSRRLTRVTCVCDVRAWCVGAFCCDG